MKKLLYILLVYVSLSDFMFVKEPTLSYSPTAISILCSSFCPNKPVWVQAVVKEVLDIDTYVIKDSSGTIILFLPTEELEALPFNKGEKVLIYGTVDISPACPEKNELYAEKVIFFDE